MGIFGERVLAARKRRKWTRRKLAGDAGLHETHLAKIERGERSRIEVDTITKLSRALAVSSDYLLGLKNEEG